MTTLIFSKPQWKSIKERIEQEYGDKIFLISWVVKRELGFSIRRHVSYNEYNEGTADVRLDFDDSAQATFFQIKYL